MCSVSSSPYPFLSSHLRSISFLPLLCISSPMSLLSDLSCIFLLLHPSSTTSSLTCPSPPLSTITLPPPPSSLTTSDLLTSDALNQLQLDCQDARKNTALHLACLQGHEESALAVLEKCSDIVTQMTNTANKTYAHAVSYVTLLQLCVCLG